MDCLHYFKALSDITRVRVFNILLHNELNVNDLVSVLVMGQSRISRHLKVLADAGLLLRRQNGVKAFYSVDTRIKNSPFAQALKVMFGEESLLEKDLETAKIQVDKRLEKTRVFFHDNAHQWDRLKDSILGDFDLNSHVAGIAGHPRVSVDLGCGTGALVEKLCRVSRHVIGVDSSRKMIDTARSRFRSQNGQVDLRLGELEHLPLGNDEADFGVISLALHHVNNPDLAVSESFRVLKTGGRLVIAEFDKHQQETLAESFGDIWLGFSEAEITDLLTNSGFKPETKTGHNLTGSPLKVIIYSAVKP